ncbi:hypothetical protein [Kibdelosporangium philippinense]|uniref:hypothetical protein n=1 Tax=Kibdelosporangium philippinense TaxID=211113 RepID=UPI00360F6FE6
MHEDDARPTHRQFWIVLAPLGRALSPKPVIFTPPHATDTAQCPLSAVVGAASGVLRCVNDRRDKAERVEKLESWTSCGRLTGVMTELS